MGPGMRAGLIYRLLLLAAIWGASFLFMRIAAPAIGALWTTQMRVALAGLALFLYLLYGGTSLAWRNNLRDYLLIGSLGSAFPFALYAYAALHIPAGYSAIVNSTSPVWGALFGLLWFGEPFRWRTGLGFVCGIGGVACLVQPQGGLPLAQVLPGVAACALAAICYAISGLYTKHYAAKLSVPQMAAGSQLAATLVLLPATAFAPLPVNLSWQVVAVVLALALVCSALAYLLYFRIVLEAGAMRALTVTFLIPLFALFWGWLFLHEAITLNMIAGCALVVLAMYLILLQPAPAAAGKA